MHRKVYRKLNGSAAVWSDVSLDEHITIYWFKGDSGSPLVVNNTLIGIVSRVYKPCASGKPDVYTNVYFYLDWIKEAMGETSATEDAEPLELHVTAESPLPPAPTTS